MSPFLQNALIFLGLTLIVGLGYFLYTQNSNLEVDSQNAAVSMQVELETADFLRRLNELKAIQLNGDIFSDERFTSFVRFSPPLLDQPLGKTNPFEVTSGN
jgi:hypothetical protein